MPAARPSTRHTTRRAARLAPRCGAALVVVALLAAGCGDDEDDEAIEQEAAAATTTSTTAEEPSSTSTTAAPSSTTSTTGATSTTTTTTTRPFDGSTARVALPLPASTQEVVSHTDLTVTSTGGEERLTFGFEGSLPGVVVEYVDPPVRESGSGDEVALAGDAVLSIRFEPASSAVLDGEEVTRTYTGPNRVEGAGTVLEVVRTGDFEALYEWAAGLAAEVPFRVETDSDASTVTVVVPAG